MMVDQWWKRALLDEDNTEEGRWETERKGLFGQQWASALGSAVFIEGEVRTYGQLLHLKTWYKWNRRIGNSEDKKLKDKLKKIHFCKFNWELGNSKIIMM